MAETIGATVETTTNATMGTTGKVVLNDEMQKAKTVCQAYRKEVQKIISQLEGTKSTLRANGFTGKAAEGFDVFYQKYVTEFFGDGGTFDQFLKAFDMDTTGLFDSIETALIKPNGLDPTLGENNKNVGQSSGTTTA